MKAFSNLVRGRVRVGVSSLNAFSSLVRVGVRLRVWVSSLKVRSNLVRVGIRGRVRSLEARSSLSKARLARVSSRTRPVGPCLVC